MICSPIGRPLDVNPQGTEMAGKPQRLNGAVKRVRRPACSTASWPSTVGAARGGEAGYPAATESRSCTTATPLHATPPPERYRGDDHIRPQDTENPPKGRRGAGFQRQTEDMKGTTRSNQPTGPLLLKQVGRRRQGPAKPGRRAERNGWRRAVVSWRSEAESRAAAR